MPLTQSVAWSAYPCGQSRRSTRAVRADRTQFAPLWLTTCAPQRTMHPTNPARTVKQLVNQVTLNPQPFRSDGGYTHTHNNKSPRNARSGTTEPGWVRWTLLSLALGFMFLFLVLPLAAVFTEALRKGLQTYFAAIAEAEAPLPRCSTMRFVASVSRPRNSAARRETYRTLVP